LTDILDTIITDKREEVRQRQSRISLAELREQAAGRDKCRNFYKAVTKRNPRGINVIAEVKKATSGAAPTRSAC